uniref:OmpH family outer membrane protein n=1 Tax=Flavobacterium sp. TaxID=239 RepID=UPI00404B7E30
MKKLFVVAIVAFFTVSCQNDVPKSTSTEFTTAFVDTNKLIEEYTEAKDLDAKYKAKSDEMSKELEAEIKKFQDEVKSFEKNAQAYGQQWAQTKGQELQQKEQQLSYAQQALAQTLQRDGAKEMDSMVSSIKKFIADYGKKEGLDYIFATGDAVSILYGKESYDITDKMISLLNEKYSSKSEKDSTIVKKETN